MAASPRRPDIGEIKRKVTSHTLAVNKLRFDESVTAGAVHPLLLLTPQRMDIAAKHIYARHRQLGAQSKWAANLYCQHIRAFSNGTFREDDGSKNSAEDYLMGFDRLLDSIRSGGFDDNKTLVPVGRDNVIIDGSHRVASCIAANVPVGVVHFDHASNEYGARYFEGKGMASGWLDAMALEYCRLKTGALIVTVYPSAEGRHGEIQAILRQHGEIAYEKNVALNRQAARNLITEIYAGEPWLGD